MSGSVASFEVTADNEGVELNDVVVNVNGANGNFEEAVIEMHIYDEDGVLVASESVTDDDSVEFDNIDYVVAEGSENLYIVLDTDEYGDNANGLSTGDVTFTFEIVEATGEGSGDDVTVNYDGTGETLASLVAAVVPAKFTDAEFVEAGNGATLDDDFDQNGEANVNVAIFRLTADAWTNDEDDANGGDLEMLVDTINFDVTNTTDFTNFEIRRASESTYYPGTVVTADEEISFDLSLATLNTREFSASEVGYYVVRADADGNGSVSFEFNDDMTAISYVTSDGIVSLNELRLEDELIESSYSVGPDNS
jgi:hypothetical protein